MAIEPDIDSQLQLGELLYQRRWLVEQLAAAWDITEAEVLAKVQKDSSAHMSNAKRRLARTVSA